MVIRTYIPYFARFAGGNGPGFGQGDHRGNHDLYGPQIESMADLVRANYPCIGAMSDASDKNLHGETYQADLGHIVLRDRHPQLVLSAEGPDFRSAARNLSEVVIGLSEIAFEQLGIGLSFNHSDIAIVKAPVADVVDALVAGD